MTYAALVASHGATSYWPLDETGVASDVIGGRHGTVTGGTLVAGALGNAITFAAVAGHGVDCGASNVMGTGFTSMSLEAWVKTSANTNNDMIVAARDYSGPTGSNNYELRLKSGKPEVSFFGSSTYHWATGTVNKNDNAWHHIVGTTDGTTVKIYVDGVEAATSTTASIGTINSGSAARLKIANYDWNSAGRPGVSGTFDAVAIYPNVVLTPTQISEHYASYGETLPAPDWMRLFSQSAQVLGAGTPESRLVAQSAQVVGNPLGPTTLGVRANTVLATTGSWATTANAVDGAYGVVSATYGSWTSLTANEVATIDLGFGTQLSSALPENALMVTATMTLRQSVSSAVRFVDVRFQPYIGSTPVPVNPPFVAAISATQVSGGTTWSMTAAEARSADFRVRVSATRYNGTSTGTFYVDYVDALFTYFTPVATPLDARVAQVTKRALLTTSGDARTAQVVKRALLTTSGDARVAMMTKRALIGPAAAPTGPSWSVWNGTTEVPATVTVWNGSSEIAVTTEIAP